MRYCNARMCVLPAVLLFFALTSACKNADEQRGGGDLSDSLTLSKVAIKPQNPLSSSSLTVELNPRQAGVEYTFRWMKNGEVILHETERTLPGDYFSRGDTIEVEVTPLSNGVCGRPKKSPPVVVINSPPVLKSLAIEPLPAHSRDDLKAVVDIFDADNDYIRITYQWEKNKEELPGEREPTLSRSTFKKGDAVRCSVGISDGETDQQVYHSAEVDILNSAPTITSRLSGSNLEGYLFEYRVVAEDQDGDQLTFSLDGAPEGMTIERSTGLIRWEAGKNQEAGRYDFQVMVSDPDGAKAIQPVTLTLAPGEGTTE